ncbi:MerR family transcriptional regulator [Cellulomonas carbonis]|uniref:MerR family transcriptional regulator n=1 Tax=Cellulomonas carbonis T26 TaxID=947969 RepID=A0A0A0BU86_9CELL|nr:MerR family transcriptional regulator [Cellulomonas carbonis]KGM11978.1 MerR family transcriptional regulator [Cellulomonas carbonis T26]GGB98103.1 MerR family transcriptional regulator [Cellulomonas carbonis]
MTSVDQDVEVPIQEVARLTGTTSRTLRHYDAIGLLRPSRVGHGGLRFYGRDELVRLQRILVLRALGVPLAAVARVVDEGEDQVVALRHHLDQLRSEQARVARQVRSVERTIAALTGGGPVMAEQMFDGFDHTQHKDEVERRWGARAYADSDAWWRGMSDDERAAWRRRTAELGRDWAALAASGAAADSPAAAELARRHVAWLAGVPGTPGHGGPAPDRGYVLGLADTYVADERFAAAYGGVEGATFVRDALRAHLGA